MFISNKKKWPKFLDLLQQVYKWHEVLMLIKNTNYDTEVMRENEK